MSVESLPATVTGKPPVYCRCGREIIRGRFLPWIHRENPGRDHHYAQPRASRRDADAPSRRHGRPLVA